MKFWTMAVVVAATAGLGAVGCKQEVSSTEIRTGGIAATIDVVARDGTSATVTVDLAVGGEGGTIVNLDGGDKLTAKIGATEKTMRSISSGTYEAEFSDVKGNDPINVSLIRTEADESATASNGSLPVPFTLDPPPADKSRATEDLTLTWSPFGESDQFGFEIEGDCIFRETVNSIGADTGSYTVTKGTLRSTDSDMPESCDLTVTSSRSRGGSADSKLDGGSSFKVRQQRSARFASKP
jgi:hypothetical protein